MDTRMVGCDRGAGDIIEDISPLFSSPICLDGNRRKKLTAFTALVT